MMLLYLGLGTNLGDKECNLRIAVNKIEERIGKVISLSAFYVTAPWGFFSANSFLNAVVCVQTVLTPEQALAVSQTIETDMGRTAKSVQGQYHDRLIDIDLLLYGDLILDTPTLKLPHPLMHKRRFAQNRKIGSHFSTRFRIDFESIPRSNFFKFSLASKQVFPREQVRVARKFFSCCQS